ncbi:MAG: NUDIX domain-containing protein [Actinobacteria bacterium]|nr:NUDIX domain-containing protein [Actinomycetota bacterium]MBU1609861.1 NUDIX domain-containing protein [Actinomycetota bacterium]MBU2315958.1 NUDIX domain-containing protein [Actinomycetota bacterium]MBU2385162.1 NUDIX domain-containing protein [Actinomycetota bacterium]
MAAAPGLRRTSRIMLIDADGAALLFFTAAPDSSRFSRWITPGGGVDPGEDHARAAVRELFEETGLVVDAVGDPVWSLDFDVAWDEADHDRGHAEYYVLRCERFTPASTNWTAEEHVDVTAHRWFTADELEASGEPFEPAELPALLRRFRAAV